MGNKENLIDANNEKETGINSKDFIVGALIGGLVGAAAALFLAPKSGRDIRYNLNEQTSYLKDKGEQWISLAVNKGNGIVSSVKDRTKSMTKSSNEGLNKEKNLRIVEDQDYGKEYISIKPSTSSYEEIHKKLQETQLALEEEEVKIKSTF
ncbi:YtxH domain-containing protein [Bacillus sp. CGMCC 1.16607]|uniref:YtxH domain-containing protein n=1 Tax=Bacillus sp. CGMCC 1.16607 TaxID=3351842 RepID=UPI0036335AA3